MISAPRGEERRGQILDGVGTRTTSVKALKNNERATRSKGRAFFFGSVEITPPCPSTLIEVA